MKWTQCERILVLMIRRRKDQAFFHAYDFMPPRIGFDDECFVGYEATARMSEVARDYPELVEAGKDGKYRTLRFRFENLNRALPLLSAGMRELVMGELIRAGVKPEGVL